MPAGGHMTTTCSHRKQRQKTFEPPQVYHGSANLGCGVFSPWSVMWPPLSNRETFPDRERWSRHTQLFGWMMYHRDSGLQSRRVLYLLQQHRRGLSIPDLQLGSTAGATERSLNGGFTIKTSPCFDVLIMQHCYLDTPSSRGPLSTRGLSF